MVITSINSLSFPKFSPKSIIICPNCGRRIPSQIINCPFCKKVLDKTKKVWYTK